MKAIKARLSKFSTVDEYINGWGIYYFSGGLLLPTRNTEPVGTAVSLHIQIASRETVLRGEGQVEEIRTNSSGNSVGMVVRFSKLDAASKELMQRILNHKKETRTASNEAVADSGSHQVLTDQTTGEHIAASEIGAIADALEETFSSIFSGSVANSGSPQGEAVGLGGFVATPAANVFGEGDEEADERKPLPDTEQEDQAETEADTGTSRGEDLEGPAISPAPADDTAIGTEAFAEGPTADGVNNALDQPEISTPEPPNATAAEGLDEVPAVAPPAPLEDEEDQTEEENPYEVSGVFVPDRAAAQTAPVEPEPESALVLTHDPEPVHGRSFADAAAQAAAANAEGEAAFDDMLASTALSVTGNMVAVPDVGMPAPVPKPKGLIGKLVAWLKGLFGN